MRTSKTKRKVIGSPEPTEIAELRAKAGLTQAVVAEMLDVNEQTFNRWEAGQASMPGAAWQLMQLKIISPDIANWINDRCFSGLISYLKNLGDKELVKRIESNSDNGFKAGVAFSEFARRVDRSLTDRDLNTFKKLPSTIYVDGMAAIGITNVNVEPAKLLSLISNKNEFVRGFAFAEIVRLGDKND